MRSVLLTDFKCTIQIVNLLFAKVRTIFTDECLLFFPTGLCRGASFQHPWAQYCTADL